MTTSGIQLIQPGRERYRRIAAGIFNTRFVEAMENLLKQLLSREDFKTHLDLQNAAEHLARRYFFDGEVKAEVKEILHTFQLDKSAVEAEAFRLCAPDLEALDRMMALRMGRRDKNFFVLSELRQSEFLQPPTDPVLEPEVPQLVASVKRAS